MTDETSKPPSAEDRTPSAPVADEPPPSPQSPGERRLAHPPSDRYRAAEAAAAEAEAEPADDPGASIARGVAVATAVAIAGAVSIVILGGVLAVPELLLIVAGFTGGGVGIALRWGAGDHLRRRRRVVVALVLALGAVALAQVGLWQYALVEGGVLSLSDYLGEVFGPLVPLELVTAGVLAWVAAR